MTKKKCLCCYELGRDTIILHLSWCPESYFYKEMVEEYEESNWFQKLFKIDPRRYYNWITRQKNYY